jgi:PAS domain S-box-containing protein
MKQKLKILHLEDVATDAEFVERELRKGGLQFELMLVTNKNEFIHALKQFPADIILSDHSLPDINSREALRLTKQHGIQVPFVLITATISEEYAVEIMREGAYDYVLKDRLQRLPAAINNAIDKWNIENERQRYFEAVVASEARYRQIVETAQEGIWMIDENNRTTFVNMRMAEILEYTVDEMIGRELFVFLDEEGRSIAQQSTARRKQGIKESFDFKYISKNGKDVWTTLSANPVIDSNGKYKGALAMVTDITIRKLAEEKLRQERSMLRALIDHLPDYIFVKDMQSRQIINNKANVELFGAKTEEETLGKSVAEMLPDSESEKFIRDDQEVLKTGIPLINKEEYIITSGGQKRWLLTTKVPLKNENGEIIGLIGVSRDITERKESDEKIAANDRRFRALIENISDGIVVNDEHFKLIYQSPSVSRILGYSEDERTNVSLLNYVHPDYRQVHKKLYDELIEKPNQPIAFQYPFLHKRGEYVWLEGVVTNLLNDPSVKAFVANYRDVTQRKKIEDELQQSEANLRAIFDNTNNGFVLLDPHYKIIDYNEGAVNLMMVKKGQRASDGQNITIFEFMPDERHDIFRSYLKRAREGETIVYDVQYNFPSVSKWIQTSITPVRTRQLEFVGYCITLNDYTEQKKAELAIRANEEKFRALVENTGDIIGIISEQGKMQYMSPSAHRILGYAKEELDILDIGLYIHPDDKNDFAQFMLEIKKNPGQLIHTTFRAKHKHGQWRSLEGSAINLIHLESIKGIVTNFRDVTEKKLLEEDLQQKKYFLEKAQETAQLGYWILDVGSEPWTLFWSKETCRIFGLRQDEFDGRIETYFQFLHPEDRERIILLTKAAMEGGLIFDSDHRIVLKNNNILWVHEQAELIRDEEGHPLRFIGVIQDITNRKVIEEVLREFNERYEILSKATNDAIWDWDINIGMVTWNHGLQTIFGYAESEVKFTLDWWKEKVHSQDLDGIMQSIGYAFTEQESNWSATYRFHSANGKYQYVYDRAYIIYGPDNKPVRMIGSMQDISERVYAMEEIEKLSLVASKTDNAVMITDPAEQIEWVNESFVKMTGYELEEVKGKTPDFLHGVETDRSILHRMHEKMKRGESVSGELVNYSKNGQRYWVKMDMTPVFNDDGKLKNFISIQSNVSEQKEFENRITAIARELASLIENANVPIFGIDRNGYINEWNKVSAELSGFTKSDMIGRKWIDTLVGEGFRQIADQMVSSVLLGNPVGNFELPVLTKNKKRLILLLSATPRRDSSKNISGAIVVAQDVTELIEYRQNLEKMVQDRTRELNDALQKEKELVDMKSKFVSIASHEFRTPLTTISLASGFLKKYKQKLTGEEMDNKLANIEKQVGHMTHLLDDVLMIGKAEAGKISVRMVEVNILDFFTRICTEVEQTTGRTHRARIVSQLDIPTVVSDEKLMRNIVINLLTNAIKFSPGHNDVDLVLTSDADKLCVKVRDYGIGIPSQDMKHLFEPFHRGANVNAIQGTGLGLSIIKKAVDLLQGSITVKSEVGKGTELTVTLPMVHE